MFKDATAMSGKHSNYKGWKALMLIAVLFISVISVSVIADSSSAAGESIAVSETNVTLALNDITKKTKEITVTVTADNLEDLYITAESNNGNVTVDEPSPIDEEKKSIFIVRGATVGDATVTVKLMKTGQETALDTKTVEVKVKKIVLGLEVMDGDKKVSKTTINMFTNEVKTLTAKLTPDDATIKTCKWTSDKPEIVTVEQTTGKITAKGPGTARITVTSDDPDAATLGKTNYVDVKVENKIVESLSVSPTQGSVKILHKIELVVTIMPADATIKTLNVTPDKTSMLEVVSQTPSSTEPNKITVVLKAIGETAGVVDVTIKTNDRDSKAPAVHAKITTQAIPVTGVKLDRESLVVEMDDKEQLKATVFPDDATKKAVTWESSNAEIATVDENGNITPKGVGHATITVKTTDGNFTAACEVEVTNTITIPVTASKDPQGDAIISDAQAADLTAKINQVVKDNLYPLVGIDASASSKLTIPASLVKIIQDASGGQLTIATSNGEVLFDDDAIDELDSDGKTVGLTFKKLNSEDYPKFGTSYIYDISILKDDQAVETVFDGERAEIGIYYKLKDGEKLEDLIVAYVYGDGDAVKIKEFEYVNGDIPAVMIYAPHMSTFMFMFHESEYISSGGIDTVVAVVFLLIVILLGAGVALFTFRADVYDKVMVFFSRFKGVKIKRKPPMSPPGQDPYGQYPNNQFNGYGGNNNGNNYR